LALATIASVVFGLAPAWHGTRGSVQGALRSSDARTAGAHRTTGAFVAAEVALCLVLVTGAGLLLRSLAKLTDVDPGFDRRNLLALNLNLPISQFPEPSSWTRFFETVRERTEVLPGVEAATFISHVPVTGDAFSNGFTVAGRPMPRGDEYSAEMRWVAPGYFEALRIPLKNGRFLEN